MSRVRLLATLGAVAALSACGGDGGSPTRPGPVSGNTIHVLDADGALQANAETIRDLVETTLATVDGVLGVDGVTITVAADPGGAIAGWGIGGYAPDARTVEISLDPGFPGFSEILPDRLAPIVAHELHHAVRWKAPGYGGTLLEALVSEGLADHFAIELLGAPVPPWSDAFPRDRTEELLDRARPEFDSPYDHARWFFGTDPTLPRWTGYTLGYRIVEAYQAANGEVTAAELVSTSASVFRP